MPAVLSKRTADWLRSAMARDSSRGFRPRRIAYPGSFVQGMQWRISATQSASSDEPSFFFCVGPGVVAWGAGVNYSHPGEENLGALSAGQAARIVWVTSAAPIPLVHDPRWPAGNAPDCGCRDCDCRDAEGDGAGSGGDSGALLFVPPDWTAPEGATDVREIGYVEVSDSGAVAVNQIQRDTIVARAIVGRTDPGGDQPEEVPPCGHPLNSQPDSHGGSEHYSTLNGGGHRLDYPGDGGFSPLCADSDTAAA